MTPSTDRARGTPDRDYTRTRRASFLPEQVAKGYGPSLTIRNRSHVRATTAGRTLLPVGLRNSAGGVAPSAVFLSPALGSPTGARRRPTDQSGCMRTRAGAASADCINPVKYSHPPQNHRQNPSRCQAHVFRPSFVADVLHVIAPLTDVRNERQEHSPCQQDRTSHFGAQK